MKCNHYILLSLFSGILLAQNPVPGPSIGAGGGGGGSISSLTPPAFIIQTTNTAQPSNANCVDTAILCIGGTFSQTTNSPFYEVDGLLIQPIFTYAATGHEADFQAIYSQPELTITGTPDNIYAGLSDGNFIWHGAAGGGVLPSPGQIQINGHFSNVKDVSNAHTGLEMGLRGQVNVDQGAGSGAIVDEVDGLYGNVDASGNSTITLGVGTLSEYEPDTGTTTEWDGFQSRNDLGDGTAGGVVTKWIDFHAVNNNLANTTITHQYAFISEPSEGNSGLGVAAPTARLEIQAGSATAGTAPLKFDSGTLLTSPETGAEEFLSGVLYFTPASTRYAFALQAQAVTFTAATISGLTTNTGGKFVCATGAGLLYTTTVTC